MAIIVCKVLPESGNTTMIAIVSYPYRVSSIYSCHKKKESAFLSDTYSVSAGTQSPGIGIGIRKEKLTSEHLRFKEQNATCPNFTLNMAAYH